MEMFGILALKILPLYFIVLLGYMSVKLLKLDKGQISVFLIYLISPFVVFHGTVTAELNITTLSIPFIWGALASIISIIFFNISKLIWGRESAKKNIMALMSGTGNTGYFGLPIALIVFGDKAFSYCVLIIMGNMLFEYTLGFYLTARGHYTKKESIKKLLRLPNIYAFVIGIFANYIGITIDGDLVNFFNFFKGAYSLCGIMLIGMGIASMKYYIFDAKFISLAFLAKFVIWPVTVFTLVSIDKSTINFINNDTIYSTMKLISFVPLAANAVAFSTDLKVFPEKVAVAVLISTFLALLIIPLALATII